MDRKDITPSVVFRAGLKSLFNKEFTQAQFAAEMGVTPAYISAYLKGKKNISEDQQKLYAGYFGMTIFEIIELGFRVLENDTVDDEVVPINIAVRILREAEKRAGKNLNSKQRDTVISFLRERLEKSNDSETENVVNLIKAFNE